jgi:hypothetical protein
VLVADDVEAAERVGFGRRFFASLADHDLSVTQKRQIMSTESQTSKHVKAGLEGKSMEQRVVVKYLVLHSGHERNGILETL